MREKDKLTVLAALAFGWHLGDAVLNRNGTKVQKAWAGLGVGWSGFWLAINLLSQAKKEYQETRYIPPVV